MARVPEIVRARASDEPGIRRALALGHIVVVIGRGRLLRFTRNGSGPVVRPLDKTMLPPRKSSEGRAVRETALRRFEERTGVGDAARETGMSVG